MNATQAHSTGSRKIAQNPNSQFKTFYGFWRKIRDMSLLKQATTFWGFTGVALNENCTGKVETKMRTCTCTWAYFEAFNDLVG
jgi:hypothetical protein